MVQKTAVSILCIVLLVKSVAWASAAIELTFSSPPDTLSFDQSMELQVTIAGADTDATYYIRGVFYPAGSSSYFGFTQNHDLQWWNTPSDHTKYFQTQGNGTFSVSFKPDPDASAFTSTGPYLFKVGRYTTGGSLTWSTQPPATLTLTRPSPTPTATPTPSPTPTPTLQPSPTPTPTATPSPHPTTTPTPLPAQPTTVQLNEIFACPEKGEKEWVEALNTSAHEITLTNWTISDTGQKNSHPFSLGLAGNAVGVVTIPSAFLNNSGDDVTLSNGLGQTVDHTTFGQCESTKSWSRIDGQWQFATPTQHSSNTQIKPSPTIAHPTDTSATHSATPHSTTAADTVLGATTEARSTSSASYALSSTSFLPKNSGVWALLFGVILILTTGAFLIWEWYNTR